MELENKTMISPFYRVKCLFAGNQSVGKSSLINLLEKNVHNPDILVTIGIEFISMKIKLTEYPLLRQIPEFYFESTKNFEDDTKCQAISCSFWDLSGQAKYFSIVKSYLRDTDICFLVFDMNRRETWNDLERWKTEVTNNSKNSNFPLLVLIGTKSDLKSFEVTYDEINERAEKWNAKFYVLSCIGQDASLIIRKMFYKTILSYHEKIISMLYSGQELPSHVLTSFYQKETEELNLNVPIKPNYCCHQ